MCFWHHLLWKCKSGWKEKCVSQFLWGKLTQSYLLVRRLTEALAKMNTWRSPSFKEESPSTRRKGMAQHHEPSLSPILFMIYILRVMWMKSKFTELSLFKLWGEFCRFSACIQETEGQPTHRLQSTWSQTQTICLWGEYFKSYDS